jgi:NAD(P)-dependent dehydrogenase (short-subunit alcohol dehydrogenase family)
MQTLAIEGAKYGIHVNALAPGGHAHDPRPAGEEALQALTPESVVPAMLVLAHASAPTRTILCAGAGVRGGPHHLDPGHLGQGETVPEQLAEALPQVLDRTQEQVPQSGQAQSRLVGKALQARALA